MKRLPLAAALLAVPLAALAQSSAVPDHISYQGRVTDASGSALGSTGAISRNVIFRIYDNPTGGTRLWSEQQSATVVNGEFSVLLGAGAAVVGEANRGALATIFDGAERFLGVSIADAAGAIAAEISPRQKLVTTPFAFRARVAEAVASQAVTTAMIGNNAVTAVQLADSAVTSAKLLDGAVATADLADGAITSAKLADGTVATADIAAGAVTAAKLGSDVGVWSTNGTHVHRTSGNVGIGTSTPAYPLSFGANHTDTTIALFDDGSNRYGLGTAVSQFRLHLSSSVNRFSFLNAPNGTEILTLLGTGQLGLGINNPGALLSLGSSTADSKLALWDNGAGASMGLGIGGSQFRLHLNQASDRFSFLNAKAGAEVFTIKGDGSVGIGTSTPPRQLTVFHATDARAHFQTPGSGNGLTDGLAIGHNSIGGFMWNYEASNLNFATNDTPRLTIDANGRTGLNTTPRAAVRFAIKFDSTDSLGLTVRNIADTADMFAFSADGQAYKSGGGSWGSGSDRRLKRDIAPLTGALEKLLQLRSVTFSYLDPEKWGAGRFTGFIAQEVEPTFPDWVSALPDGTRMLAPRGFESLAVQALRELRTEKDTEIAALRQRIQDLETAHAARLSALEQRFAALARTVGAAGNND